MRNYSVSQNCFSIIFQNVVKSAGIGRLLGCLKIGANVPGLGEGGDYEAQNCVLTQNLK